MQGLGESDSCKLGKCQAEYGWIIASHGMTAMTLAQVLDGKS